MLDIFDLRIIFLLIGRIGRTLFRDFRQFELDIIHRQICKVISSRRIRKWFILLGLLGFLLRGFGVNFHKLILTHF